MPTISVALSIFSTFRHSYKVNGYSSFTDEEVWTQSFAIDKVLIMELQLFKILSLIFFILRVQMGLES